MFEISNILILEMIVLMKLLSIVNAGFIESFYSPSFFYHDYFFGGTGCGFDPKEPKIRLDYHDGYSLCPLQTETDFGNHDRVLFAHPHNCSLFFKCDWNGAVIFECPEDLHFNDHLQTCDWPWEAGCDRTRKRCPRPRPICPARQETTVYLPHTHHCDQFYQCSWGKAHLQSCPTGLHFDQYTNICDWPHIAKCNLC